MKNKLRRTFEGPSCKVGGMGQGASLKLQTKNSQSGGKGCNRKADGQGKDLSFVDKGLVLNTGKSNKVTVDMSDFLDPGGKLEVRIDEDARVAVSRSEGAGDTRGTLVLGRLDVKELPKGGLAGTSGDVIEGSCEKGSGED